MKPRHAAELALVGWYLMVPLIPLNRFRVDIDAPSSKWGTLPEFRLSRRLRINSRANSG